MPDLNVVEIPFKWEVRECVRGQMVIAWVRGMNALSPNGREFGAVAVLHHAGIHPLPEPRNPLG